ncbi:MAG TPA: glycosyltransferase family 4 protein [Mycobacteriales bacterium]|nr:glycosyltransferase family 4 protein [Mycobacteriales bacterium]
MSDRLTVLMVMAEATGGIGRHVRSLAVGLPDHGIDVMLCAPPASIDRLELTGTATRLVPAPVRVVRPGPIRQVRRRLRAAAREAAVVHAHGLRPAVAVAAAGTGRPMVATWHNAARGHQLRRRTHAALEHYVARASDLTLTVSDDLSDRARRAGARAVDSAFAAAPPLPPPAVGRDEIRRQLGVGERPMVLAVGRLAQQKRLDLLIAAAAGWAGSADAPIVVIAGSGAWRPRLEGQIRATGAPVILAGARQDIADLLAAADVAVLTSEWEGRSLSAQEALQAGVPLVTTAVGGVPGLVGDAAVLVPFGDVAALRAALERVLGDPELRRDLATRGRRQAATWPTLDQVLARLAEQYRELAISRG